MCLLGSVCDATNMADDLSPATIRPSAQVADTATIGAGSTVWELAQVREDARLGTGCILGRGAYVGPGKRSACSASVRWPSVTVKATPSRRAAPSTACHSALTRSSASHLRYSMVLIGSSGHFRFGSCRYRHRRRVG